MRTVYREKALLLARVPDVYIYLDLCTGSESRGKRSKPTAAQKKPNQRHREEKLVRLLHANFTPDDLEII